RSDRHISDDPRPRRDVGRRVDPRTVGPVGVCVSGHAESVSGDGVSPDRVASPRVRLVRFRHGSRIATGAVEGEFVRPLQGTFFENPVPTGEEVPVTDLRLLAPVLPSKVVCVGRNYVEHAIEMDSDVPEEPLLFLKPSTTVIGPGDYIPYPSASSQVDHEGELAVVIGRLARRVPAEEAGKFILGFTCGNDVTARDLQRKDGQWTRGKGF